MNNQTVLNETTRLGASKVKIYGWVIADQPGVFMSIAKDQIMIPAEYQRDHRPDDPKILRIASEWSWVAFGTLSVCRRGDGFYVLDGGHRLMAALKRSDISVLPCMTFEIKTVDEEAKGFLRANRNRKPMTTIQAFKALVVSGDPDALLAQSLVEAAGRKISDANSVLSFSAPSALMRAISDDREAAKRVFPVVALLCEGETIARDLLSGLMIIERRLDGRSVSQPDIKARLLAIGGKELKRSIQNAKIYHNTTGERVIAIGIQNAFNKGLRSRKIQVVE